MLMSKLVVGLSKIAKSPVAWIIVFAVYLFIHTSINTIEVINSGTTVAHGFRIIVAPTNNAYVLGDIAPGESKSLWFIRRHDGQARYITTINDVQVTGVVIGYFSMINGKNCKLHLSDTSGKTKAECS